MRSSTMTQATLAPFVLAGATGVVTLFALWAFIAGELMLAGVSLLVVTFTIYLRETRY
jgi:predicted anti-sigma-YlaC factor YlaD